MAHFFKKQILILMFCFYQMAPNKSTHFVTNVYKLFNKCLIRFDLDLDFVDGWRLLRLLHLNMKMKLTTDCERAIMTELIQTGHREVWKEPETYIQEQTTVWYIFVVKVSMLVNLLRLNIRIHFLPNPNHNCFFNGPTPASSFIFRLFKQTIQFFTTNQCEKRSIQYTAQGFEPTTSWTWVLTHNH